MAKKKAKSLKGIWGQSHERIWNKVGGKTNTDQGGNQEQVSLFYPGRFGF